MSSGSEGIETILIVDDEENIRQLLVRLCEREGYNVLTAASGSDALAILGREPLPALAIVDLRLPDMDGLEILRRVRERTPRIIVIILTGYADFNSAVEALGLGAYDYIQKDALNIQLIPVIIKRALDRRRVGLRNEHLIAELERANAELERQRVHQLHITQQLVRALAGGLQAREIAEVMVQLALSAMECDAAGVLVAPPSIPRKPFVLVGGVTPLTPEAQRTLLEKLIAHFPTRLPLAAEEMTLHVIPSSAPGQDEGAWPFMKAVSLTTRENTLGVMALASHREKPCDEEALALLQVLATQGAIALENAFLFARMCELATRDSLTGLYNHSHFFERLEAEINRSERHGYSLAIIMLDMDRASGLKEINDTYGHQVGDAVLQEVAKILSYNVRLTDSVARYGGDEFAILAPETDKEGALILANRLCRQLREVPIRVMGLEFHITMSVGVAVFTPKSGLNAATLVDLADQGMYLAKEQGGNRVFMVDWD